MTRVALTWYVFEQTGSPQALGLLTVAYTAPVFVGGLLAGVILDRFDRRTIILMDSLARGLLVLLIPVLYALGLLQLWHVYVVAAVYGLLMMIPLAGAPSVIPSLVDADQLETANALETLSFTLSNVIGPPLAGLLIARVGAPNVLVIDGFSYFLFALPLAGMRIPAAQAPPPSKSAEDTGSLRNALGLLWREPVLLSTTLMFMAVNIGLGAMFVWLPLYADRIGDGGPQVYGLLLGVLAVGEVASAFLAGGLRPNLPLGALIAAAEILAGASLALLLVPRAALIGIGLFLLGFFTAPLTIWAQSLRMQIIPDELRGRTFALLRTLMQGAIPVGGAAAGLLLPVLGIPVMIGLSGAVIGLPGVVGLRIKPLRAAGTPDRFGSDTTSVV